MSERIRENDYQDDEIDLGAVFKKIWDGRRTIFLLTLVSFLTVLAVGVVQTFISPPGETFYKVIRFNFPTVTQGVYPSGEPFSRNDIVSAPVVSRVYEMNHLKERGVEMEDFMLAVTATPFSPNIQFIREKYKKLLSNKKLTPADILDLEKKYSEELAAAQLKFARVNYSTLVQIGLTREELDKVLSDIPKVWSHLSINERGVLDLNIPTGKFFDPGVVEQDEYIRAVQYLQETTSTLKKSLKRFKNDQIGAQVKDPETGFHADDLLAKLNSLENFTLLPLVSLVSSTGLARNTEEARVYTENKIQVLSDKLEALEEQAKIYRSALELYQQGTNGIQPISAQQPQKNMIDSGVVQYGSDFLTKLADLLEKQKDAQFRQSLLEKEINTRLQIVELQIQLKELKRALAQYQKIGGAEDESAAALRRSIEEKIQSVRDGIADMMGIYQRMIQVRTERLVNNSGALYDVVSTQVEHESGLPERVKRIMLIALAVSIVAMFVGIFIALLARREADMSEKRSQ